MEVQRKKGGKNVFNRSGILAVGLILFVVAVAGCTSSPETEERGGSQQIHGYLFVVKSDSGKELLFSDGGVILNESELKEITGKDDISPDTTGDSLNKTFVKKGVEDEIRNSFGWTDYEIEDVELHYDSEGPTQYSIVVRRAGNYRVTSIDVRDAQSGDFRVAWSNATSEQIEEAKERELRASRLLREQRGITKDQIHKSFAVDYFVSNFTALRQSKYMRK